MSTPHTIEVEINEDGEIKATVIGVDGPVCGPLSEWLDQLGTVEEDSPTGDFFATPAVDDTLATGWGS